MKESMGAGLSPDSPRALAEVLPLTHTAGRLALVSSGRGCRLHPRAHAPAGRAPRTHECYGSPGHVQREVGVGRDQRAGPEGWDLGV